WMLIWSAPALANASMKRCGSDSIRGVSKKSPEPFLRRAARVSGPKVRVGTKCPSMMSRWIQGSLRPSTIRALAARREWPPPRMEGTSSGVMAGSPHVQHGVHHPVGQLLGHEGHGVVLGLELVARKRGEGLAAVGEDVALHRDL